MSEKRVFSGIQPSGNLHIGNYIGALKHWAEGQNDGLNIFCVVDMHAITVPQDPKTLNEKTLEIAAIILASGVDPEKSILFVQSHNPDHANMGWIMNTIASMGQMNRMTQYKEKSEGKEFVSVGLFDYPALMAADILLYDTTHVPVGEDQKQHVEFARDLAERFNSKFGETFVLPEPVIPKVGGRVMSLVDPTKKMSKSDPNKNATIYLLDSKEDVQGKIKSATTDSDNKILVSEDKPGVSNLIEIYSEISGLTSAQVEEKFAGKSYGQFKEDLTDQLNVFLSSFQEKYNSFRKSKKLKDILGIGAEKAKDISHKKLVEVYEKIGFVKS
jgi:tryptophanyl-tRNA synthetase